MQGTVHVTCPACAGVNRVLADRLGKAPLCGRCQAPLLPGQPRDLDGPGLERLVARNDLPVVVDFWSPSCGPCRMMAPQFEQAARALAPGVLLARCDVSAAQDAAMRHGIRSVPTLVLFRQGREAGRISGALPAGDIAAWVRGAL
ncbi:thioredoxin family protein [Desulfocurvus vexinensis]|uniref:thioredoxin family protein n=1 Tax=Desulfocurvus vexinensis TaxID=399548 RepID=UPI00048BA423|nr:thioredoxin domain-containing protein [Desulfocurvus vexinensis]